MATFCIIEDCEVIRGYKSTGLCDNHQRRLKLYGDPMSIVRVQHRMRYTPEYNTWARMKGRVSNPSNVDYADYGGRGIAIAPEWRDSFMAFFEYVGKRPSPKHSIDRINNEGNYEPGNVRWATQIEQANNRRKRTKFNRDSRGRFADNKEN